MRYEIDPRVQLDEQDIAAIKIDPKSRDDIPKLLRGLQHIFLTPELRERVFSILEEVLTHQPDDPNTPADAAHGHPGMSQWEILVLGVIRSGLNTDYEHLQQLANEHNTLRQMLGHSRFAEGKYYALQTLRDNMRSFTPEVLDRINQEIVRTGHKALR